MSKAGSTTGGPTSAAFKNLKITWTIFPLGRSKSGRRITTTGCPYAVASATQTGLVPRFWGEQKVADLSVFAEKNHDELLKIGREFSIVTPNTSLMVLERLEQYVQYGIEPPRSLPQMREEYLAQTLV